MSGEQLTVRWRSVTVQHVDGSRTRYHDLLIDGYLRGQVYCISTGGYIACADGGPRTEHRSLRAAKAAVESDWRVGLPRDAAGEGAGA